jgi:hypothetical protein
MTYNLVLTEVIPWDTVVLVSNKLSQTQEAFMHICQHLFILFLRLVCLVLDLSDLIREVQPPLVEELIDRVGVFIRVLGLFALILVVFPLFFPFFIY